MHWVTLNEQQHRTARPSLYLLANTLQTIVHQTKSDSSQSHLTIGLTIRVSQINIEGISWSKSEYISKLLAENKIHIVTIQETHTAEDFQLNSRGQIPGYRLVLQDRHGHLMCFLHFPIHQYWQGHPIYTKAIKLQGAQPIQPPKWSRVSMGGTQLPQTEEGLQPRSKIYIHQKRHLQPCHQRSSSKFPKIVT